MIYYLGSILFLTIVFAFLYKARIITFCPICAGAAITWVVGVVGIYMNQSWADPVLTAILLGASLGAMADKYGSKFGLVWKTLVVLLGLPAIYYLVQGNLWLGAGLVAALLVLTFAFGKNRTSDKTLKKDIFNQCC